MSFNKSISKLSKIDFEFLNQNAKRKSKICGFDFEGLIYCSYGFLKSDLPSLLNSNDFEKLIFELFKDRKQKISIRKINKENHNNLISFVIWLFDELKAIAQLEKDYLSSPPDAKMVSAGVKDLDQFGELNVIDALLKMWCGAYNHKEIESMPYHFIFDNQHKMTIENKIQRNLMKQK